MPPCGGHPWILLDKLPSEGFQVVPPCGGHPRWAKYFNSHDRFKSCPRVGGIWMARTKSWMS